LLFSLLRQTRQFKGKLPFACSYILFTFHYSLFTIYSASAQTQIPELKLGSLVKVNERYLKQDVAKLKMLNQLAQAFHYKGENLQAKSLYPDALEFYEKALTINQSNGNKYGMATNLNSIADVWSIKSDNAKAQEYFEKALSLFEEINNQEGIAKAYNGFGNINLGNNNKKALEYYQKALSIFEQLGNKSSVAANHGNIGSVYRNLPDSACARLGIAPANKYPKALEYLNKALAINKEIGSLQQEKDNWDGISKTYEKMGDFAKAHDAYKKYIVLRDSIGSEEVKNKITQKEMQYAFEKKETALKYEQSLNQEQLQKQQLLNQQQSQALLLKSRELALSNKEKELAHLEYLKEQAEKQDKEKQLSLTLKENELIQSKSKFEATLKLNQISLLQKESDIAKIRASRNLGINFGLGGALLGILFVALAFYSQNKKKEKLNLSLTLEKQKSDDLLLNILPEEVATELKQSGEAIAKQYNNVTVLFTDFVGFTTIS